MRPVMENHRADLPGHWSNRIENMGGLRICEKRERSICLLSTRICLEKHMHGLFPFHGIVVVPRPAPPAPSKYFWKSFFLGGGGGGGQKEGGGS